MLSAESLGWMAGALTLLTFSMRSMVALRVTALAANLVFIAYGATAGLTPVLVLHLLLLPCNAVRLAQLCRACKAGRPDSEPGKGGA